MSHLRELDAIRTLRGVAANGTPLCRQCLFGVLRTASGTDPHFDLCEGCHAKLTSFVAALDGKLRTCMYCGCSEIAACPGGCDWSEWADHPPEPGEGQIDICTACRDLAAMLGETIRELFEDPDVNDSDEHLGHVALMFLCDPDNGPRCRLDRWAPPTVAGADVSNPPPSRGGPTPRILGADGRPAAPRLKSRDSRQGGRR